MGTRGKTGATGPNGHRGACGATGRRGKIGKAGPKGSRGLNGSLQNAEVLDRFVTNFDDVYQQLTGLLKLVGQMQRQINELAAKADVTPPKA
jgi:collagen triple helix repeat protein